MAAEPSSSPDPAQPDPDAFNFEALDRSLSGTLPCIACRYNLQGLSVLGVCPECGTAVRATILALVDPHADELRPIRHSRLVALGLLLWSGAAFLAAIISWYVVLASAAQAWRGPGAPMRGGLFALPWPVPWRSVTICVSWSIWLSGVGALMSLVRPHAGLGRVNIALASLGVAAYVPLGWVATRLLDATSQQRMLSTAEWWSGPADRQLLRLALGLLLMVVLVGLRPNARALVARSLAMRTGRVDRQTMLVMAGVVALMLASDALGLLGARLAATRTDSQGDMLQTFASAGLLVCGLLLTLGIAGAMIDCVRIARAVLAPLPGPRQVLGGDAFSDTPTTGGGQ